MLHIMTGASGSGKSYELFGRIIEESEKDRKRNFLIVVPEQFTLEAQREIINRSPRHGIMNIDILSFPRLAHRVFEEIGYTAPVILEDAGKTMIVKKVALDNADKLSVFAGKVHRQGFIEQMKSVIAEFYQYSIGHEELEKMISMSDGRYQLKSKLKDIEVIYRGFREFINDRFIMNEELLEIFAEKIADSQLLKDSCIVFDGFTGFTVMQLKVMEELFKTARDVYVTVTAGEDFSCDADTSDSLFELSGITVRRLKNIAERAGIETAFTAMMPKIPYRFRNNPALAALEKNIFRKKRTKCSDNTGISLISCESPLEEIRYVISRICALISGEDYRYGDIAVIVPDVSMYGSIAAREFAKAGIPVFIDSKKSILGSGPVELLRSMIMAAIKGFDRGSVFRFLKSEYSGFDTDSTAGLENYCAAKALRGASSWEKDWTRKYHTAYGVDLDALNECRKKVCEILINPALKLAEKINVKERIDVLKGIMESLKIKEKLEESVEKNRESAQLEERLDALEKGQLYDSISGVFERICLLLGEDVIPLSEFAQILDTGFAEAKLAMIPQGRDSIVIGDMERTRLRAIRALFFIGVNDGVVPKGISDSGILSYADRMLFEENDIELSPVGTRSSYLSEFYLYLNLTKPSEKLFISYHRMTAQKRPGHRSFIFSNIMDIYPNLEIHDIYGKDREMLVGSDMGRHTAARVMRDVKADDLSDAEKTICSVMGKSDPDSYELLIKAAFDYKKDPKITAENAKGLYGRILTGSVTMLERYATCAYSHFLKFGLKLEERAEFKVGAVELGNIYHKAVELYGIELKKRGIKWHDIMPDQRTEAMNAALDGALEQYDEIIGSSMRNRYIRTRAGRVLERTIAVLDYQVKGGSFEPEYFEESFRAAGEYMELVGKIDRIDISERNGKKYLRVIDYKSGKKAFDLVKLFNGLQIQLAVYINEAGRIAGTHGNGDAMPAGMYYYNIDDPFMDGDEDIENRIINELRLKGPTSGDHESLKSADDGLVDDNGETVKGYSSNIISAGIKKDGGFKSNSDIVDMSGLKGMGRFAEELMNTNAQKILNGEIELSPYIDGTRKACEYCPYISVCGFEQRFGDRYKKLARPDEEEIRRLMEES